MSSAKKKSNLTKTLWDICNESKNNTTTQEKLLAAVEAKESEVRQAINALLGKNLLVLLQDAKGRNSYRAVDLAEAKIKGDMDADEGLVYSHIAASRNEGIWTKTLKSKTNLHQTVLTRVLKKLETKNIVKTIKSVKYPTRKIYMLEKFEPSADVTGGPWYTDHELDVGFIETVSRACLAFIREQSFPKPTIDCDEPLYPTSSTKRYPSLRQLTTWVRKSGITPTLLEEEHIQMLIDMLIYSGDVEALPYMGGGGGDLGDESSSGSESGSDSEKRKKKKKKDRKRKSRKDSDDEDGSGDDDDDDDGDDRPKKRTKRSKSKSKRGADSDSDDEDDAVSSSSKRSSRKRARSDDDDSGSEPDSTSRKRKKSSKKRRDASSSESESDSRSTSSQSKSKKSKSRQKSKSKSKHVSSSEEEEETIEFNMDFASVDPTSLGGGMTSASLGGAVVYRALRPESMGLGWSETPCGRCPQFDFCKDKGPVNAEACKYYGEWLELPIGERVVDE